MRKTNIIKLSIIVILFIVAILLIFKVINMIQKSNEAKAEEEFISSLPNDTEEKIKVLFIHEIIEKASEKVLDYRIESITILTDKNKQDIINSYANPKSVPYTNQDVLAYVSYSIKPDISALNSWTAGNGQIEGEWIVNKTACILLRENTLIDCGTSF